MSQYIITIVPVLEDNGLAGPASQTIVRIETGGGRSCVTELTMRAPEGGRLVSGELPYVNFEMLLKAFIPAHGADSAPATRTDTGTSAPVSRATTQRRAAKSGSAERSALTQATISRAAQTGHLPAGRAYRRRPDPADLEAAYEEAGTIAGVAAHFGVPVHTAQGWISRLRRKNAESANTG